MSYVDLHQKFGHIWSSIYSLINHLLFYFGPLCFLKPQSEWPWHSDPEEQPLPKPTAKWLPCCAKPSVLHHWDPKSCALQLHIDTGIGSRNAFYNPITSLDCKFFPVLTWTSNNMGEEATVLPWPHRKKGHLISRSISVHYNGKKWPNLKAFTVF